MLKGAIRDWTGKQALVATVGIEPQVVTLTLDALRSKGFTVEYAFVLHPNPSSPPLSAAYQRLKQEEAYYKRLCPPVKFHFVAIRDGDQFPEDFATEADVAVLLRVLYKVVVALKRKGARVHLSIAGGRKVMTAMGMVVAQLLLDDRDHVWHLLSEGALLQSRAMHARNPNDVTLVPVPVLRWSLLPSTIQELLVWDDPYRAIERQKQLQEQQRWRLINEFWRKLTPSEQELVKALVKYGETIKALAKRLGRSPKTVANQLQSIYEKYREHFDLPPDARVRGRLIADLTIAVG